MIRDQGKGKLNKYAGKVQQDSEKLAGSTAQQFKGLNAQIEGNFQSAYGDAKEIFRKSIKHP